MSPDMPLLWVLRENLGLTGTKFGCGLGQCGACTVHLDGVAVALLLDPGSRGGRQEGDHHRGPLGRLDHPVQQAWVAEQVPQCGYCQSGQIMIGGGAAGEDAEARPTREIDTAMTGNICRCGTYQRIRRAIQRAAARREDAMTRHDMTVTRGARS